MGPDFEGSTWSEDYDLDHHLRAVRRDLEDLLNSHPPHLRVGVGRTELEDSLLSYGLPDIASLSLIAAQERTDIGTLLKAVIERFEPRLGEIRVALLNAPDDPDTKLRYRINARLRVDPAPEVTFETVIELATGQASVTSGQN
jgi:type VI secretion system protein ImpF